MSKSVNKHFKIEFHDKKLIKAKVKFKKEFILTLNVHFDCNGIDVDGN